MRHDNDVEDATLGCRSILIRQLLGYAALALVSWVAVGLLLVLSIADSNKSVGAALLDLVVVFSNLTLLMTARGEVTGSYPYDFIDASANGYLSVLAFAGGIIIAMLALGALVVASNNLIRRRAMAASDQS